MRLLIRLALVLAATSLSPLYPACAQAPSQATAAVKPATAVAGTTPSKTPTIDQSLEMQSVSSPKISPDGRQVVYEESRTDWEANAFETDLWLADVATGQRHRLTVMEKSSGNAKWSPDGRWIAFTSNRPAPMAKSPADKQQIYVMPAEGGEAQQLTKMEDGVDNFEWISDSKRILVSAEAPETKAMKDRKESFGDYEVIHADYKMVHLWLVDLPVTDAAGRITPAGEPKLLTPGETFSVGSFSISPDGARIAFSAARDPDLISGFSSDIYTLKIADGAIKKIVSTPGPDDNPQWSPDGSQIAYETSDGAKYFFYANQKIAVVASDGDTPRVVSGGFDEDAGPVAMGAGGHLLFRAAEDYVELIPARSGDRSREAGRDAGQRDCDAVLVLCGFQARRLSWSGPEPVRGDLCRRLACNRAGEADARRGTVGGL